MAEHDDDGRRIPDELLLPEQNEHTAPGTQHRGTFDREATRRGTQRPAPGSSSE